MSRRKSLARREPNGKPQRQPRDDLPSPTEVSRLRDAAVAGLKDAIWGSMLGQVYLRGKITGAQFAAGKRWADLAHDYSTAAQSPRTPRSTNFETVVGGAVDPDSPQGLKEAQQHAHTMHQYLAALEVLQRTGGASRRAVAAVCEHGLATDGQDQLEALRTGLTVLAMFWSERRK